MIAKVPVVPGPVERVADELPEGEIAAKWYPCAGPVDTGWTFNGTKYTPPS